jgi:hypothetical protein
LTFTGEWCSSIFRVRDYKLQNNMKKNIVIIVGLAIIGAGTLTFNSLRAQDASTPPPVGAPQTPLQAPPSGPAQAPRPAMPPPGFRGRQGGSYRQAAMFLRRAKMDLENSKDDFAGHRQTAIDACEKAMQELEAVQASIQATAAKASAPPPDAQAPPSGPAQAAPPPQ